MSTKFSHRTTEDESENVVVRIFASVVIISFGRFL